MIYEISCVLTVSINKYLNVTGSAPEIFHRMLRSAYFRLLVMGVVLANGIITATMNFKHDGNPREFFYEKYYYIEVIYFILSQYFFIKCLYDLKLLLSKYPTIIN